MLTTSSARPATMIGSLYTPCSSAPFRHLQHSPCHSQRRQGHWQQRSSCLRTRAAATELAPLQLNTKDMLPVGDRFLIEPLQAPETTAGGLILKESNTGIQQMHDAVLGVVIGVGTDCKVKVSKGDTVLFVKKGVSDVPVGPKNETAHFVAEESIIAILNE